MPSGDNSRKYMQTSSSLDVARNPGNSIEWTNTILTGPISNETWQYNYIRLCFHVVVWLCSIGLACTTGFGIQGENGFLEPVPLIKDVLCFEGVWPLFADETRAEELSDSKSSHHYTFNDTMYYMPDFTDGVWHFNEITDWEVQHDGACPTPKLEDSSYIVYPSVTTKVIGMTSVISLILGFVFMLTTSSVWNYQYFQEWGWPNVVLQIFTNYAFVGQMYIFVHAAAVPDNEFYRMSLAACVFVGYLVVLLYCISASLDFLMLPRGFIPSLAISFQLVNFLVINADEGGAPEGGYTQHQKGVALALVLVNVVALLVMVVLRMWTRSYEILNNGPRNKADASKYDFATDFKKQDLGDFPFFRSVVLTLYASAATLSIYKWSFTSNANPGVWCFSVLSVFTQFLIMAVIFYPASASAGGITNKRTDEMSYTSAKPFTQA